MAPQTPRPLLYTLSVFQSNAILGAIVKEFEDVINVPGQLILK